MAADPPVGLAVVLVGGFGTRLRPLTDDVPKPMLPVGHRPMILELFDRLVDAGIRDIVLALGFRPEPFATIVDDGHYRGAHIHYAVEPAPLDTAGAIAFAARSIGIDDTFVVANGDVLTDAPIADLMRCHREAGVDATLQLTPVADPSAYGVVELDGPLVHRFVEKPQPGETESHSINAGTYVFEPSVLDLIPSTGRCSVEREVFPTLVADRRLAGCTSNDYWIDTGRPETYLAANLDLIAGRRTRMETAIAPSAEVAADAFVGGSIIGRDAHIHTGARVERSVILPGARIGAGAAIVDSIVAGVIEPSAHVVGSVIGWGYVVGAGRTVRDERLPEPS